MSKNRVIGVNNELPWNLPADMKYFMNTTNGHHVIMGRKTFESMPGPLKNRTNIVITRDLSYLSHKGILLVHCLRDALAIPYKHQESEVFVIGGGQIYTLALPVVDRIYLTEIDIDVANGQAFFPKLDRSVWRVISEEKKAPDEKNQYHYSFKIFERKSIGQSQ